MDGSRLFCLINVPKILSKSLDLRTISKETLHFIVKIEGLQFFEKWTPSQIFSMVLLRF